MRHKLVEVPCFYILDEISISDIQMAYHDLKEQQANEYLPESLRSKRFRFLFMNKKDAISICKLIGDVGFKMTHRESIVHINILACPYLLENEIFFSDSEVFEVTHSGLLVITKQR